MTVYDLFLGRLPYFSPDLCILVLRTQKWPIHRGIQRGNLSNTTEAVVGFVVGPSSSTQVGANTSVVGIVRLNSSSSSSSVIFWLPYSLTIKLLFEPTHHMLMTHELQVYEYRTIILFLGYYRELMGIITIKSDQINDEPRIQSMQDNHRISLHHCILFRGPDPSSIDSILVLQSYPYLSSRLVTCVCLSLIF